MKTLVVDGGRGAARGALGAVRALGEAGHEVHVTVSERYSTAAWSRHCRRRVPVPAADGPAFGEAVRRLLATEGYDAVFPAGDGALLELGWPGADLVDKEQLHRRASAAGMPTPRQWSFRDGDDALDRRAELAWPVVVKPAAKDSNAPLGTFRADSPADLEVLAGYPAPVVVEEWLSGGQRSVAGVMWQGQLRAVVHQRYVRTWPRDCGPSCAAVTTGPDEELEARLPSLLSGFDGLFQCQLLDGRLHDVNPRVYGSISLAVRAGVNLPDLVCRLGAGHDLGADLVRARPGVRYRWIEGDLRHVAHAWRGGEMSRREAVRILAPRRDTAHPDVRLSDPGPFAARLAYAVHSRWGAARRGGTS